MSADPIVLITGHEGFIGSNLSQHLRSLGFAVHGLPGQIENFSSVQEVVGSLQPSWIVHLAGISHVADCDRDPAAAYRVNLDGTVSVLEAILATSPKTRLLFASTAQVYQGQDSESDKAWDESRSIVPQSLYARTKRAAEAAIQAFCADQGLSAIILRLFNHAHFTQSPAFFLPHLHQSLARGERTIPVGNLDLWRDIGSLQDLLTAFQGVLGHLRPSTGECEIFNVCSGKAKKLADVAAELARQMGVQATFEPQASRIRPGEPLRMEGDSRKLQKALNWSPQAADSESLIRSFLSTI